MTIREICQKVKTAVYKNQNIDNITYLSMLRKHKPIINNNKY